MPIYEYRCESCDHYEEFLEKISAPTLKKCPSCGRKKFKRLVSLSAFHLKGDGWYVTDFRDKDKKKAEKPGDDAAEPKKDSGDKDADPKKDAKADDGKKKADKPKETKEAKGTKRKSPSSAEAAA